MRIFKEDFIFITDLLSNKLERVKWNRIEIDIQTLKPYQNEAWT
jgi:hypothetical protein